MGLFFFLIGIAGAYMISRKMNEVPIIEKEPPPTKYTRVDAAQLFDKLGTTSVNGLSSMITKQEYIGENQWGIPMFDCYFKNGSVARLFGNRQMTNLHAATGANKEIRGTTCSVKKQFKEEFAMGQHRRLLNQLPDNKALLT
jgi:hypothetical protein